MSRTSLEAIASWHGYDDFSDTSQQMSKLQIHLLSSLRQTIARKPLLRLLRCRNVEYDEGDSLSQLRKRLRSHIGVLIRGKRTQAFRPRCASKDQTVTEKCGNLVH